MKIKIGFSPCPNDTFIFDALVNQKIDTQGIEFEPVLEDVQTLNQFALGYQLPLSKISYGVLPLVADQYNLLDSGGALGKGVGPLLISKKEYSQDEVDKMVVAIPGKNTSAHVLFSLAFPRAFNKKFMVFSEIEEAVLKGEVNAGVIIHENRFTYMTKGLVKLMDLGNFWEEKTGCPIPLGGIVIDKKIDKAIQKKIGELIRESIEFAFRNYPELAPFVKEHSQEMEESVMRQHIELYVNDYSLSLGESGRHAVDTFLRIYEKANGMNKPAKLSLVE